MTQQQTYKHIENISKKTLEQVKIEPFKTINGEILYNLTIIAQNKFSSSINIIVLNQEQKQHLEKMFGGK